MGQAFDLTPEIPIGRQLIQAYREGGFTIGGIRHDGSVLVLPDRTVAWPIFALDEVTIESLQPVLGAAPAVEILVLGAGRQFAMVSASFRSELKDAGVVIESMDTRAACRTFNVLLAEDRRVAAALIAL